MAKLILKINYPIKTNVTLLVAALFLTSLSSSFASSPTEQAINDQVESANDCEKLARAAQSTSLDAEDVFSKCIDRRAIAIAMLVKYGIGQSGEINAFEKIQAYSYLLESPNPLIQKEAEKFSTAAGAK